MPSSLPPKFIDVDTAKATHGYIHVIGVVVDLLPKTRSGGSSFVTTFTIKDCDIDGNPMSGLKIKYFNDDESLLPELQLHDVILLRNIRMRLFRGSLLGVAAQHDKIPWTIFRRKVAGQTNALVIRGCKAPEPSPEEKAYSHALLNSIPGAGASISSAPDQAFNYTSTVTVSASRSQPPPSTPRDRFSLIKDVKAHTFADLVVEVVKTWREYDKFILYVTDYTSHGELYDYPDPSADDGDGGYFISRRQREWNGPFGQMTLQVTLWQPHASFAQNNVKEGDIIFMSNVHIKNHRVNGNLDGSMHTNRLHPHRINVSIVDLDDDERVAELVRRKKEYWRNARISRLFPGNKKKNDGAKSSKKTAKQQKEKPKKEVRREEGQVEISEFSAPAPSQVKRNQLNPNIQAAHPAIPCRSLEEILDGKIHLNNAPGGYEYRLPFQNINYRAVVRVVDFYPPRLEDFAVSYNPEDDILSESGTSSEDSEGDAVMTSGYSRRRRIWEWRFCLLVEDGKPVPRGQPKERMKLYVSGKDAEYLLKIDATDLRKNETRLDELREKLFHLWADLEEKKRALPNGSLDPQSLENPSGKPFMCCIKEYGIRSREEHNSDAMSDDEDSAGRVDPLAWERRFHMFGTTINA
ncbi:hypothetical protein DTO212C5_2089 [Paecilomyces variotii]|nr:hypothetical protein DTO212C5_2089 [Paecilomyces variotii]